MTATVTSPVASDEMQPAAHSEQKFHLELENFNGPFDVLLHLITARELDITEVALAEVTDEFIGYLRALQLRGGDGMKVLDETTEFLVVASTLLDLKAARLLPRGEMADDEDFELLESRDLLFARLLQYKAFKEAANILGSNYDAESARVPREVALEPQFAALLPELIFSITPEQFAAIAGRALEPKPEPVTEVGIGHLHGADVTIADEATTLHELLSEHGTLDFSALVQDAGSQLVVVVRFLALLEMFRQKVITFDQPEPLGTLWVSITRQAELDAQALGDDYDASADREQGAVPAATSDPAFGEEREPNHG